MTDLEARSANTAETRGIYRKRPVEIEAQQFLGADLLDDGEVAFNPPDFIPPDGGWHVRWDATWESNVLVIETLEGEMLAAPGDWIIQGVQGEYYPCKPDIFEQTYEFVRASRPEAGGAS